MEKECFDGKSMNGNISWIKDQCSNMNLSQLSDALCVAIGTFSAIRRINPDATYSADDICKLLDSLCEIVYGRNLLKETEETDD